MLLSTLYQYRRERDAVINKTYFKRLKETQWGLWSKCEGEEYNITHRIATVRHIIQYKHTGNAPTLLLLVLSS